MKQLHVLIKFATRHYVFTRSLMNTTCNFIQLTYFEDTWNYFTNFIKHRHAMKEYNEQDEMKGNNKVYLRYSSNV